MSQVKKARDVRMDCEQMRQRARFHFTRATLWASARLGRRATHHADPDVDGAVGQEPVQEGALGGHHVWVLLLARIFLFLLAPLVCGQAGADWGSSGQTGRMRWRVELRRLLQGDWFTGLAGR